MIPLQVSCILQRICREYRIQSLPQDTESSAHLNFPASSLVLYKYKDALTHPGILCALNQECTQCCPERTIMLLSSSIIAMSWKFMPSMLNDTMPPLSSTCLGPIMLAPFICRSPSLISLFSSCSCLSIFSFPT